MRIALALVMIVLAGVPVITSAQTPAPMPGLRVIAERQYAGDPTKPIDTSTDGVYLVTARVYQFENADQANATFDTLLNAEGIRKDLERTGDADKLQVEKWEGVGDRASVLHVSVALQDGDTAVFRSAVTQKGGIVVSVTVVAGSEDSAKAAEEIAGNMIQREPGASAEKYDGTGRSTGGVWDMFPASDAKELHGMQAYADKETRPSS